MTDATQFKETYLPFSRMMYAEAVRLLGDPGEAEDAVQDVYVRLWQRRDALGTVDNKRAYVMAMVRNRCLTLLDSRPAGRVELDAPVLHLAIAALSLLVPVSFRPACGDHDARCRGSAQRGDSPRHRTLGRQCETASEPCPPCYTITLWWIM